MASATPAPAKPQEEQDASIDALRFALAKGDALGIANALGAAIRTCCGFPNPTPAPEALGTLLKENTSLIVESLLPRPAILAPQEYDCLIPALITSLPGPMEHQQVVIDALGGCFGCQAIEAVARETKGALMVSLQAQGAALINLIKRRWIKDAVPLLERPEVLGALFVASATAALPGAASPVAAPQGGEPSPIRFVLSSLIKAGKWTTIRPALKADSLLASMVINELTLMGEDKIAFKLLTKDINGSLDDHPLLRRRLKTAAITGLLRLPARSVIAAACYRDEEAYSILKQHIQERVVMQGKTLPLVGALFFRAMDSYLYEFLALHPQKCMELRASGDRAALLSWLRNGERLLRELDTATSSLYRKDGVPTGSSFAGAARPLVAFSYDSYKSFLPPPPPPVVPPVSPTTATAAVSGPHEVPFSNAKRTTARCFYFGGPSYHRYHSIHPPPHPIPRQNGFALRGHDATRTKRRMGGKGVRARL
jgi:hypothetical protein